MKNPQPAPQVVLNLDWGLLFTFEIETDKVAPHLLEGVDSLEVRPGISLLDINLVRYAAADIEMDITGAWNIDASVRITPVPYDDLPNAETAACIIHVGSDRLEYLDICESAGYPVYRSESLEIEYNDAPLSAHVKDARGSIFSFQYSNPNPDFESRSKIGQEIVSVNGSRFRNNFRFETTSAFEKKGDPDAATLYNHPFFLGMDVSDVGRRNLSQMALHPGTKAVLSYYIGT
jgi:hypothetical protein